MTLQLATMSELYYLREFYQRADFGPAHSDVVNIINDQIEENSRLLIPKDYRDDEEDT